MTTSVERPIEKRPWPVPHVPFLAFGPIDQWFRLLFRPRVRIPMRYLPRVVLGVSISLVITLLTLPERLLVGLWLKLVKKRQKLPGPVFVLGYYRSGTTHLQLLLSRDPNLYSPQWTQALSPQGFSISWGLTNCFLLPLFPASRPQQDNVAFGSDLPAEDDFALLNGALASTVIGRHMLPERRDHYDRYHDLKKLSPEELQHWRDYQEYFVRKLALLAGQRRVLLKTPAHTARVEELMSLFGQTDGARFIHISREPESVYRSNVRLHRVINEVYHLQDPLPDEEIDRRIIEEYLATGENYVAAKAKIPAGRVAELRLEDLQADPVGEVKRIYAELDLPYSDEFEQRLLEYLDASRTYEGTSHKEKSPEEQQRVAEALLPLTKAFRHDQPPIDKKEPPVPRSMRPDERRSRLSRAAGWAVVTALVSLVPWLGLTWLLDKRLDGLVWLVGIAVGTTALVTARRGTTALGLWAVGVTLAALASASLATTSLLARPLTRAEGVAVLVWMTLGVVGAFKLATRRWV